VANSKKNKTYKVGFGKPPESTQFKKGVTGNPKGRPKGSKSIAGILTKMGRERVKVTINGKTKTVNKLEAVFMQLSNKALNGDLKAMRELLWACKYFPEATEVVEADLGSSERDQATLKSICDRMLSTKSISKTSKRAKAKGK